MLRTCIIVCDVDGLKEVNDEQGHAQGDRLIISAAQNIAACLREGDLVARIGGDEFAVLLTNTADQECGRIVQRIRSKIEQFNRSGGDPQLSLSVGYALWNGEEPRDLQSIFKEADDRMYKDKRYKKTARS